MSAPANAELRFLVVDALAGVQTFARQLLEGFGFPAHSIRCASDTDSALALGLEFKPDFLITDWFAKAGMNGIALYQRLKTVNPGCRLALLSFEVTPAHEAEAHAAGSRFLLRKPFTADDLKSTMQRSLELLATERPELAQRLNAVIKAQQGPGKLPVKLALPPLPPQLRPATGFSTEAQRTPCSSWWCAAANWSCSSRASPSWCLPINCSAFEHADRPAHRKAAGPALGAGLAREQATGRSGVAH